jgi:hypothetical protein
MVSLHKPPTNARVASIAAVITLTLISGCSRTAFARQQSPGVNIAWGEITAEELRDTSNAGDQNATAVILYEKGYVTFDEEFRLVYNFHRRVKILTAAGYSFGTIAIPFNDEVQDVDDLEGLTMALDAGGNVARIKLKGDDIFEEDLGNSIKRIKFTLPSLAAGCIIEYRYTMRSKNPHYFPNWNFQDSEPTRWSEFDVEIPGVFGYAYVSSPGFHKFAVEASENQKKGFKTAYGMQIVDVARSHWVMKDAPAVREEEYMTTSDDYLAKVTFQLAQVQWPGEMPVQVLQTWEKLIEGLNDYDRFGGAIDASSDVAGLARTLTSDIADTLGKIAAIHRNLRSTVLWDGTYTLYASADAEDVLKAGKGGSADINLLLVAMLRSIGIEANPVLISTRGHGKIQGLYPMADQFNDVICAVMAGGKWIYMDATERLRPYQMLPRPALNHKGLMIRGKAPVWVDIESGARREIETMATLALGEDGGLSGELQLNFKGYAALGARLSLAETKPADYVKGFFESAGSSISLDSVVVENLDSIDLPLRVRASVSLPAHVQVMDTLMFFDPNIFKIPDNPFKKEQRLYPIDYGYGIMTNTVINITLPEHFDVVERPPDVVASLANKGGSYVRQVQVAPRLIQYQTRAEIRQLVFNPNEYPSLRSMYEKMATSETEQVVVRRGKGAAPK